MRPDETGKYKPPSRAEFEVSLREIRAEISEAFQEAKADAAKALEPVQAGVNKALGILERAERREQAKAEVEAELIAARTREEQRAEEIVRQRVSWVEAADRHNVVTIGIKESIWRRRSSLITAIISTIIGLGGGSLLSRVFR